jgi:hypothetical protein
MELFLDRAREVVEVAHWGPEARGAALEVCRHLDGIPLALELAAAQLAALTPQQLRDRLDQRFELLVGARGRRRQRQQTLHAVMDWSWERLEPSERDLLAALAVFAGGWTLEAAEYVGGGKTAFPVAPVLRSLVAKSLVEPARPPHGRFSMLETVRLYAQQRLVESGRASELRDRHADWYRSWSGRHPLARRWISFAWVEELRRDVENIASAVDWYLDHGRWDAAAELVGNGAGLWIDDVIPDVVVRWTKRLFAHDLPPLLHGRLGVAGAFAATASGDHELIVSWATEAVEKGDSDDHVARAVGHIWQAAPRMVLDAEATAAALDAAMAEAVADGSDLAVGLVRAWQLQADLCTPGVNPRTVTPEDADQFGGLGTWGWEAAAQTAIVIAALAGDLELASRLRETIRSLGGPPYATLAAAIAGDLAGAEPTVPSVIHWADRHSNLFWRPELVLTLGILALRRGDAPRAVTLLETARRAPMFMPFFYELARRYLHEARAVLSPDGIDEARTAAKRLTVEAVLDEVRARDA